MQFIIASKYVVLILELTYNMQYNRTVLSYIRYKLKTIHIMVTKIFPDTK